MIGERLAEIRTDHGDTQTTLANKLHVSCFTVSSWVQGKSSPGHEMLVKICRLYNVSSDYLLGLVDDDSKLRQRRQVGLSKEELAAIREFEEFLVWKKLKKAHNQHK